MSLADLPIVTVGSRAYRQAGTVMRGTVQMVVLLECVQVHSTRETCTMVKGVLLWQPGSPAHNMLAPTNNLRNSLRHCQPDPNMDFSVLQSYLRYLSMQHCGAVSRLAELVVQAFQNAGIFEPQPDTIPLLNRMLEEG